MRMPFGKYKGQELAALPDEYLCWLVANIPLRDPLRRAVAEEITDRDLDVPPLAPSPPRPPRKPRESSDEEGAWTMGGDPQEIIAGDFPISSRHRGDG